MSLECRYYIRPVPGFSHPQVWKIDDRKATRVGVSNPEGGAGTYFEADPGETIWDAIRRQATGWFGANGESPFYEAELNSGEFYPRIARPIDQHPHEAPGWSPCAQQEANVVATARGQLSVLARQLGRICQTIHPEGNALESFGHDIRNLLILACTEVETHWRGVLIANHVARAGDHLKTSDYVKLSSPMRLSEYAIAFPSYPWLAPFKPYEAWGRTGRPTQELSWFDGYNAVKHDRERHFARGTLSHVFEAISACVVILVAQFGLSGIGRGSELGAFFQLAEVPHWPLGQVYIFPYDKPGWSPVNCRI